MNEDDIFYPRLVRQAQYPKTKTTKKNKVAHYYANYNHYREDIRKDCKGRCVYCDSHENENGGQEHMNLDHFRPKSIPIFAGLKNDPKNLVWVCVGCNRLKWDHWPDKNSAEAIIGDIGFVDPFISSYKEFYDIGDKGELKSKKSPAEYMLKLLALNRQSKRRIRELRLKKYKLIKQFSEEINIIKELSQKVTDEEQRKILVGHIQWLIETQQTIAELLDFELH